MTCTTHCRLGWLIIPLLLILTGCAPGNLVDMLSRPFGYGLFAFILLVLDLIAIYEILNSRKDTGGKVLWILLIVFFPFVGLVLYYFFGRD